MAGPRRVVRNLADMLPAHARPGHTVAIAVLALTVIAALLLPWPSATVDARRYGRRNYKRHYNYGAAIARCKGRCARTGGAIKACRTRTQKGAVAQCRQAARAATTACAGDRLCKSGVRQALRTCVNQAAAAARADVKQTATRGCGRCCQRSRGGGGCLGYLQGSAFYGSTRYRGRLRCSDGGNETGPPGRKKPGSPSGSFLWGGKFGATDVLRARGLALLRALADRLGG